MQVGRTGDGPGPVVTNAGDGVEDVKSTQAETKTVEQQQNASKNETAVPYKATAKEASNRKAELSAGATAQQAALNNQLKEKEGKSAGKPNVIYGSGGNDNIHISKAPGLPGALGLFEIDINGQKQYMTKQQLENTEFRTGAGKDTVVVDANVTADITVDGGSGDDVIIGGGGNDNLKGGSGNDIIAGRDGNDRISGGRGNDYLFGGKGDDIIDGGAGNDYIAGGAGKNQIHTGKGKDQVKAGGNDAITTGGSQDINVDAKKK